MSSLFSMRNIVHRKHERDLSGKVAFLKRFFAMGDFIVLSLHRVHLHVEVVLLTIVLGGGRIVIVLHQAKLLILYFFKGNMNTTALDGLGVFVFRWSLKLI